MRCSRCKAENPAGMRFCGQCAAPLGGVCPSCGAANPPENRFSGSCAVALDTYRSPGFAEPALVAPSLAGAPAHVGEMKQVSVLFCDIVGSTALTERLGAEAMRDLITRFLEVSSAEVKRYDGTIPQFAGDGFMAVFGKPLTHEDHVRRALLAALGVRRALGDEGGTADRGLDLPVRIGIHAGPVVFGPIGGNLGLDTAIGDRKPRRPAAAGGRAGCDLGERDDLAVGATICPRRSSRAAHPQRQSRADPGLPSARGFALARRSRRGDARANNKLCRPAQ